MKVVNIKTRTASGQSCIGAKRIYADNLFLRWTCPECKQIREEEFNKIPLISYGHYCHCFYCESCGYESDPDNKMYKLLEIKDDGVDLAFSESNDLKAYLSEVSYMEIKTR